MVKYLANADCYNELPKDEHSYVDFYTVAGSLGGLHILADSIGSPKSITFIDYDGDQLDWTMRVVDLIKDSENIYEFLTRYFCREVTEMDELVYTEPDREVDPILAPNPASKILQAAMPVDREYAQVLNCPPMRWWSYGWKGSGPILQIDQGWYAIAISNDGMGNLEKLNYIYPHRGFHSYAGYIKVRHFLRSRPVRFVREDFRNVHYNEGGYLFLEGCSYWFGTEDLPKDIIVRDVCLSTTS